MILPKVETVSVMLARLSQSWLTIANGTRRFLATDQGASAGPNLTQPPLPLRRTLSLGEERMKKFVNGKFEVVVFGTNGTYAQKRMSKSELITETKLNARDLIVLDSGYHRRPRPVLLVRPTSMVVSMSYIRAIIRHDSVYLFHPNVPKVQTFAFKFGEFLQGKRSPFLPHVFLGNEVHPMDLPEDEDEDDYSLTGQAVESSQNLPFELRALEGILGHVSRRYHNRTLLLSPLVKNVLHTLSSKQVDPEILHQLLPMKDTLSQFEIETTLMRNVLTELIHSEDDMLEMLLSEKVTNGGQLPAREQHEKVELLLENYCSQFVDIAQESYYLRKRVESTQSIIELKLDTHRNYILRINIQLAMGSLALGVGTTLTGYFGANLVNGMENHPTAFYWLGIFSASAIAGLYQILKRQVDISIPRMLEGKSFNSIFNHLDEIQQILSVARSRYYTGNRSLTRTELRAMLRKIAGVKVSDEDLDIIYDTFDLDRDGVLTKQEVKSESEYSIQSDREVRKMEWTRAKEPPPTSKVHYTSLMRKSI